MPTLSLKQKQAITEAGDAPIRITDPDSDAAFVLIRVDIYDELGSAVML